MAQDTLICQSCSMPIADIKLRGTEKNGSVNNEYCVHCYKDGTFTKPNATLEEMIELYAPKWGTWMGKPSMTIEQAKLEIRQKLSPLKRWTKKETPKRGCCCCKK